MDIDEYITESEEIKFRWVGGLEDVSEQIQFVATEQRLLYVTEGGFKDIDYEHISSVEVTESTEKDYDSVDMPPGGSHIIFGGIGCLFGISILLGGSPIIGLIILPISIGVLLYGWMNIDDISDLLADPDEKTTYNIQIITGDETPQQITFETKADIVPDLSKIVRNSNSSSYPM